MSDFDKVFDTADFTPQAEPIAEAPAEPITEEPQPTPAAEQLPVVAEEPQPEPAPVEQPREDDGRFAPVKALQEERQKRQELERRLAEIEARSNPKPSVEQPKAPDPYDDPQGFAAHQQAQFQQSLVQERFRMSHEMAKQQFGAETVDAARLWAMDRAAKDPAFDMAMASQAHPLAWIVQQHKRDALMQDIGEDPDAYVRRRALELGIGAVPQPVAAVPEAVQSPTAPAAVSPPRSLASAPAAGGAVKDIPTGPMTALDATFK